MNNIKKTIFKTGFDEETNCTRYEASTSASAGQNVDYTDCLGNPISTAIGGTSGVDTIEFCAIPGSVTVGAEVVLSIQGAC